MKAQLDGTQGNGDQPLPTYGRLHDSLQNHFGMIEEVGRSMRMNQDIYAQHHAHASTHQDLRWRTMGMDDLLHDKPFKDTRKELTSLQTPSVDIYGIRFYTCSR